MGGLGRTMVGIKIFKIFPYMHTCSQSVGLVIKYAEFVELGNILLI